MLGKFFNRIHNGQKGITGLETAIILIAFVVVAAVFAYTVLSAGLFSTQRSQEAVYSGIQEARSTVSLKGAVIAKAENTGANGYVSQLTFAVTNALNGDAIDFTAPVAGSATGLAAASSNNTVVISYIDKSQRIEDLYWTVSKIGASDTDNMLEPNETFQITIGDTTAGAGAGNLVNALNPDLITYTPFTIEIKTAKGSVLTFERTTPAYIDAVFSLN